MNLKNIRKYHLNIFTTNLLAVILATLFAKSYKANAKPLLPLFLIVICLLAMAIIIAYAALKPAGKIKTVFPHRNFILLNMAIAVIVGFIFLKQTGLLGLCFTLLFAFFLFEVEHLIHDGVKR